jgi:subtilisin family serine protease
VREVKRTLPVFTENISGLRVVATREITVRFKPKVTERQQNKVLNALNLTKERANEFTRRQFIVAPKEDIDETVILDLANRLVEFDDAVEYAAPNFVSEHRKAAATNDPRLNAQWHLNNNGTNGALQGEDVDAFAAWDITLGGSRDIVIAVVDDGVEISHRDLKANIWINPDPNAPDRNGRNFYDNDFDPRPRYFNQPFDMTAINDIHGTPCAGVAAAAGNNRRGVVGIAYKCRILPVKIFGADVIAPNDQVANAIRYAGLKADVVSCSWSSPWNTDLEAAINDVTQTGRGGKGCLVFCATGNERRASIAFPARHPNALAVGASNDQGKRSLYSNYGQGLSFVAPSSDPERNRQGIATTDVSRRNRGYNLNGSYTNDFGGTSSATPLAAGIGALVLSINPALMWQQARDLLQATADKIDAASGDYQNGYSLKYGYGRLNAHRAALQAQSTIVRTSTRAKKAAKRN